MRCKSSVECQFPTWGVLLALAVLGVGRASADVLVYDRATAWVMPIVLPRDPSPSQRYAAKEYARCMQDLTGMPISPLRTRKVIRILTADPSEGLGDDGFTIREHDEHLEIRGSRVRGCLYGVYELLERHVGYRWYSSWCTKKPQASRLALPKGFCQTERPAFRMRQPFWFDVMVNPYFAARNKVNGFNHTTDDIPEEIGGDDFRFGGDLPSCHTFDKLLPVAEHFEKHPEWFSYFKGQRQKVRTQLCLTNPEVLKRVTDEVLRRIRMDPGARFYGVSQNDWYGYCECTNCAAIDAEEESHAGTMVRFVNAVAEAVEKEFPDVIIETLAYQYTRKPPKKTKYRHNVVPCLCTYECDVTHDLASGGYSENRSFKRDLAGWRSYVKELYVWDYTTFFPNYPCVCPNLSVIGPNVRFFRDNKVAELFSQGACQGCHAHYAELKAWLTAKLMWNPDADEAALVKDFTDGFYGAAGALVREDIAELNRHALVSPPLNCAAHSEYLRLPADYYVNQRVRLAKAFAATKDDPESTYNLRSLEFALDFTMLERFRKEKPDETAWTAAERDYAAVMAGRLLKFLAESRFHVRLSEWPTNEAYAAGAWRRYVRGDFTEKGGK